MSVLKIIGTTARTVGLQTVNLTATLERDDQNGQLFLRVAGSVGQETFERKHSIGSSDGVDALSGLAPAAMAALIQPDLDALRQTVLQILTTRLGVIAAGSQLT
jgi:hypothetical protein